MPIISLNRYYLVGRLERLKGMKQISGIILVKCIFSEHGSIFKKLRLYGDFPIVKSTLVDNQGLLVEASKRAPRNEVARFIIQDLDSAIMLMQPTFKNKNRLSSTVAQLIKSRVALYEASWLTYHQGTPFVPVALIGRVHQ